MDKEKIVRFLWISMWCTLVFMVLLKVTFNYYYPIVLNNSALLKLSTYIDTHPPLLFLNDFTSFMVNGLFISLCVLHEKWFRNWKQPVIMLGSLVIIFIIKWHLFTLGSILVLITYLVIPLFLSDNQKRWIFITFIIDNIIQILSNVSRGNNLIIQDTALIRNFMFIDYYLMFAIYYIGGIHMGMGSLLPWFTKKETVIDAKIEKLQSKIKKLEHKKECLKKQ